VVYLLLNVNGKKLVFLEVPFGVNSARSSKILLTLSKYVLFRMADPRSNYYKLVVQAMVDSTFVMVKFGNYCILP
jgi:hypothetical protein